MFTYGALATPTAARVGYSAGDSWNFGNIGGLDDNTVAANAASVDATPHPAATVTYTYDALDRLTGTGTAYDTAGNTTATPGVTYGYDGRSLLTSTTKGAASSSFGYDGEARQTTSTTAGTTRRLRYAAPGDTGATYTTTPAGAVLSANLAGPTGLLATYTGTTPTYYYTTPRGDTAATTTGTGVTVTAPLYDEYGNPTGTQPAYGFLAQHRKETDPTTGLTLMGVRGYNPATGRFLQTDPIDGGSANDYDYVAADPINNLDLDGTRCRTRKNKKGLLRGVCNRDGHSQSVTAVMRSL